MEVKIECPCPGHIHAEEGDTITLRDKLSFTEATAIRKALGDVDSDDEEARAYLNLSTLTTMYCMFGITAWTMVRTDPDCKVDKCPHQKGEVAPVHLRHSAIRAFLEEFPLEASIVADAADNLYSKAVLIPLLARASTSSRPKQTDVSTYQTSGSTPKRKRQSKPSSTSTTRTENTAKTSPRPDGVSSGLQS